MKYVELPPDPARLLPVYLTAEEYVAHAYPDEPELFFMWQVEPTVIFGRNQMMESELDVDYCRREGIRVYRRKSGGGCVFADMNNIMFSYITTSDNVTGTFARYTSAVAAFLRSLGLDASDNSRNDILIGDRKVSGNAYYRTGHRSIAHGTMLYDIDAERMTRALTPSSSKLHSKGVSSVRSRVTTIREHLDISLEDFKLAAREFLCDSTLKLSEADMARIQELSKPYFTEAWINQRNPAGDFSRRSRLEGVGEFQVDIDLKHGRIDNVCLTGDFFPTADLDSCLLNNLRGVDYNREAVARALIHTNPEDVIAGLSRSKFTDLLF